MAGSDRDLKIEAAAIGDGVRDLMIEAAAMRGGFNMGPAAVGGGDRGLKMKKKPIRPEEGGILRLKKEAKAAWDHWFLTRRKAAQPQEEDTQAPRVGNKRKKVVKIKLPKEYVDHMAACPFTICADFSDEELARRTPEFREIYAAGRFLETKNREYWNALIAQYNELGYAEDENEVTDDDDDEEEEEVVKN
ncbi:hypothetical protein BDA96_08G026300 [Sorghum bicolor]|uniref:Uncharacterized protein n=1 Tax=Sorghum bicolor TaxID=4558 RepID=A0A921U694_SORBI|nr:hypothetical protein BDA96_08G026300 [Sorghum bicolor]